jgi:hypothetical protein
MATKKEGAYRVGKKAVISMGLKKCRALFCMDFFSDLARLNGMHDSHQTVDD